MSITIDQARTYLLAFARNAGDQTGYPKLNQDLAMAGLLGDFLRITRCTTNSDSVAISQDSEDVDFSSITGFHRARIVDIGVDSGDWATAVLTAGVVTSITVNRSLIYTVAPTVTFSGGDGTGAAATATLTLGRVTSFTVSNGGSGYTSAPKVLLNGSQVNYSASDVRCGIEEVGVDDIRESKGCSTSSGTPTQIAFTSHIAAKVWRLPKADGTLSVLWNPLLVSWTKGVSSDTTTVLNLPDDHVIRVLQTGGPAALQLNDPEHGYSGAAFAQYREYRESMMGADSLGAKVIIRSRVR